VAAPFSGVSNGALIVAGGANFPEAPPWKGGEKIWWKTVYVLEKTGAAYQWVDVDSEIQNPAAYGVSITLPQGVLCIGGNNADGVVSEIFLLQWDNQQRNVIYRSLGSLPDGFEVTGGAEISGKIFLTGILKEQNHFVAVETDALLNAQVVKWEVLSACPGPPRKFMSFAAQHNGTAEALYVFGGRSEEKNEPSILLRDAYAFNVHQTGRRYSGRSRRQTYTDGSACSRLWCKWNFHFWR
jgi:N-acetylneuraminic acid mutarotase